MLPLDVCQPLVGFALTEGLGFSVERAGDGPLDLFRAKISVSFPSLLSLILLERSLKSALFALSLSVQELSTEGLRQSRNFSESFRLPFLGLANFHKCVEAK